MTQTREERNAKRRERYKRDRDIDKVVEILNVMILGYMAVEIMHEFFACNPASDIARIFATLEGK